MTEVARLAEECAALLEEAVVLLERIPDPVFQNGREPSAGGVGNQLRHCLDCFACLAKGLDSGRIDYDRRDRDTRVEEERRFAVRQLRATARGLRDEVARAQERDLVVRMDEPGRGPAEGWHRSSLARELRFLATHTIHHFALIALLLERRGIEVDPAFGLAPATAHFQQRREAASGEAV